MKKMIVQNRNTGKQRKIKVSEIYASEDLARVGDMINPEEIIVTILDEKTKLQDRPYLDVEVVEIKTKKKKEIPKVCVECGLKNICRQYKREYKKLEKPGTWVNGENLDKIKFPCLCSYMSMSGIRYCELDYIADREYCKKPFYRMKELKQGKVGWEYINTYSNCDLEKLFKFAKPKILKGKVIIFEEEAVKE